MARSRARISVADAEGRTALDVAKIARARSMLLGPMSIVTLEGRPGFFCEGLDLERWVGGSTTGCEAVLDAYAVFLSELDRAPVPVVALVDGPALGGGMGLAAVADVVLATRRASFALPEVFWGLLPAVALAYVARRTGPARARMLAMGAQSLDAEAALRFGLIDEIVDDLEVAIARYESRLSRAAPHAVAEVKRTNSLLAVMDPAAHTAEARRRFGALVATDDTTARLRRLEAGDIPWRREPLEEPS